MPLVYLQCPARVKFQIVKLLILLCEIVQQLGRRSLCIYDVFFTTVILLKVHDEQLTEFASLHKFYCGECMMWLYIYISLHNISVFANEVFYRDMQC